MARIVLENPGSTDHRLTRNADGGIIHSTMEILFQDPSQVPLPPDEIRIRSLHAEPWPDGRRVAVEVELTPFQQRPNLHINVYDAQGQEVASIGAMQILQTKIGFTLHLRHAETQGQYTVATHVAYPDLELDEVGRAETSFEIK